jgi:DNA-binding beta-propeller fold protein YncE
LQVSLDGSAAQATVISLLTSILGELVEIKSRVCKLETLLGSTSAVLLPERSRVPSGAAAPMVLPPLAEAAVSTVSETDADNQRVLRTLDSDSSLPLLAAPAQPSRTNGVAVIASSRSVFISAQRTHCIQHFQLHDDEQLLHVADIGRQGSGPVEFRHPRKLLAFCSATGADTLLVADSGNARIQEVCVKNRALVRCIGVGSLTRPHGLALLWSSVPTLAVSEPDEHHVLLFDFSTGTVLKQLRCEHGATPTGICFSLATRSLYVAEAGLHRMSLFSIDTGTGGALPMTGTTSLCSPRDVICLPNGSIVICDTGNNRLCLLDASGVMLLTVATAAAPAAATCLGKQVVIGHASVQRVSFWFDIVE